MKTIIRKLITILICLAIFATLLTLIFVLNKKETVEIQPPNTKDIEPSSNATKANLTLPMTQLYGVQEGYDAI